MANTAELLLELRDIHEPVAPAASSPLLLGLLSLSVLVLALGALAYFFRRRSALNRSLQLELRHIKTGDSNTALYKIAVLLRRVMHHLHGDEINQLESTPWLKKLDTSFNTRYFSEGRGSIFGDSLYIASKLERAEIDQLCDDIGHLIGRISIRPLVP